MGAVVARVRHAPEAHVRRQPGRRCDPHRQPATRRPGERVDVRVHLGQQRRDGRWPAPRRDRRCPPATRRADTRPAGSPRASPRSAAAGAPARYGGRSGKLSPTPLRKVAPVVAQPATVKDAASEGSQISSRHQLLSEMGESARSESRRVVNRCPSEMRSISIAIASIACSMR